MKEAAPTRPYRQGRRAEAAEARTQAIREAAVAAFVAKPFDQITLGEVAERAGVGLQTLIRRVQTKDGLVALVNEWTVPAIGELRAAGLDALGVAPSVEAAVVRPRGRGARPPMGIVQKSLAAGVPVVAVPFGRDQPEVGRRIAESGTGVLVNKKDLSASRIRSAMREALTMRPAAVSSGGPAQFADAVEEMVPTGLELEAHYDRSLIR